MVDIFSTTLQKTEETPLSIGIRELLGRRTNGKVTSRVTIGLGGLKCGTRLDPAKKRPSCGLYGIRRWRSMSGEQKSPRPLFPSNVSFVCPIRVNR